MDHKENCTFDESGVMGWCSSGLASHQGALQLALVSGKRSAENDKGWKQTFFFFCIWHKQNFTRNLPRGLAYLPWACPNCVSFALILYEAAARALSWVRPSNGHSQTSPGLESPSPWSLAGLMQAPPHWACTSWLTHPAGLSGYDATNNPAHAWNPCPCPGAHVVQHPQQGLLVSVQNSVPVL